MRRTIILLAAMVAAAACTSPSATTVPAGSGGGDAALPPAPGGEVIEVLTVFDGDSIEARVDGVDEEIRMLGINATERTECWSQEARTATADLLSSGTVSATTAGRDRFGRLLGYLSVDGVFVNASLVAQGHAMTISNDHSYADEFRALEDAAFAASLGMWGPTACGSATGADVRIDDVDGNPPGQDDDPRNGESALIANHGDATVDLTGWVLRDESSVHRYEFPAGTDLGPGDDLWVFSICGVHEHCFGEWETVWSNGGDTALLLDGSGNVVDRVRFVG